MVAASDVAGHTAIGQITSESRRSPFHDGRGAMRKSLPKPLIPFPEPLKRPGG
jgi:hypothetical protein